MKPFDLEKALAGEPVVTRDGREVTQLHLFDADEDAETYPLVGILDKVVESWTKNGHGNIYRETSNIDLFMKSKTVVKWVILENNGDWFEYAEEDKANAAAVDVRGNKAHRIEWEE